MEIPQKLSLQRLGLFTYIDNCTENSVPNIFAKCNVSPGIQREEVDKASGNVNSGRYIILHILIW